jgi:hypothetical protein
MSTVNVMSTGLRALACGVGALAITTVMSWSLVHSTSTPPMASAVSQTQQVANLSIQQRHVWFGQSQPAVLVD